MKSIRGWAEFLKKTRAFLDSRGFVEVITPHVVPVGAFEATLDCLEVRSQNLSGQLHTSPEIAMKCCLAHEAIPIYQICRSFRDDPPSPVHFPEFTMLEIYHPHWNYRNALKLTQSYFEVLAGRALDWNILTVDEAFLQYLEINLAENLEKDALAKTASKRQLYTVGDADSWEDIFFKLMLSHIEPRLDPSRPTILIDYPPSLCTLLKKNENTGLVERFEIYWNGMEICNGGTELVDPVVLKKRYELESKSRQQAGKAAHPYPEEFEKKMKFMPPMAGVAIGMERLSLCLDGISKVR